MPKRYAKHGRNKRKPNMRQQKFVKELAKGKSLAQAARDAGYSEKNANQSGYQALAQLRGRVPELLERHGLGEEVLIDKYLRPLLDAEETKFFPTGITVRVGKKNKTVFQVNVQALAIRHAALRTAFELHGSYAPRDPKEAAQYGVRIIRVDIPRPANEFNQFVDVIPESALSRHGVNPLNPTAHENRNTPAAKKTGTHRRYIYLRPAQRDRLKVYTHPYLIPVDLKGIYSSSPT
jgi:hypothetical protein